MRATTATERRGNMFAAITTAFLSIMFMLRTGYRNDSALLIVMMAIWVSAPPTLIAILARRSAENSLFAQRPFSVLTRFVMIGSILTYAIDALHQLRPQAAFAFVVTPLVAWCVLIAATLVMIVVRQNRRSVARS